MRKFGQSVDGDGIDRCREAWPRAARRKPATAPIPPPPPADAARHHPDATAPAAARTANRRGSRTPTEDEIFAKKSVEDLNNESVLGDAFFDLDSDAAPRRREAGAAEERRVDEALDHHQGAWSRDTATRAGHPNTTWRWATAAPRPCSDYLVSLGIAANRVQIVSKGKEQPFCNDENDACWQQNRRGHFMVTAK